MSRLDWDYLFFCFLRFCLHLGKEFPPSREGMLGESLKNGTSGKTSERGQYLNQTFSSDPISDSLLVLFDRCRDHTNWEGFLKKSLFSRRANQHAIQGNSIISPGSHLHQTWRGNQSLLVFSWPPPLPTTHTLTRCPSFIVLSWVFVVSIWIGVDLKSGKSRRTF